MRELKIEEVERLELRQCFPCVRELKNRHPAASGQGPMFPVCAGIETIRIMTDIRLPMFPVCAGIETFHPSSSQGGKMFPVCAGIEITSTACVDVS